MTEPLYLAGITRSTQSLFIIYSLPYLECKQLAGVELFLVGISETDTGTEDKVTEGILKVQSAFQTGNIEHASEALINL